MTARVHPFISKRFPKQGYRFIGVMTVVARQLNVNGEGRCAE